MNQNNKYSVVGAFVVLEWFVVCCSDSKSEKGKTREADLFYVMSLSWGNGFF